MLTLKCLSSGSIGNCYLLSDEQDRTLVLDCGVNAKDVKVALSFDLSKVVAVVATHSHNDHFKAFGDFEKMGCETFAPHIQGKIRENKVFYPYGVQAFMLPHGETTSYGFLIRHCETGDTFLYATDYEFIRYTFQSCKINHYLIECNYQTEYVDVYAPNLEHKIKGHCSFATCYEFIKNNINASMKNVIICHLGTSTANPDECVGKIKGLVGDEVFVDYAIKGKSWELKK